MAKLLKIVKEKVKNFFSIIYMLDDRMTEHHIFLVAAGIAFNILLYIIPMILVALYIVHLTVGVENLTDTIEKILKDVIPPNERSRIFLHEIIKEVKLIFSKSTVAGWIGIVSLLWLSSILISSIRTGLNRIFHISTPKVFFIYRLKDIMLTIIMVILILLSTVLLSSYVVSIRDTLSEFAHQNLPGFLDDLFSRATLLGISLASSFILFFLLFRFVPNKKLPRFVILMSTILCVVLIEISRNLFAWYVSSFGTYGKFYGTYAVLVSMAIWVYYLILIVLISAELSQFVYELRQLREPKDSGS